MIREDGDVLILNDGTYNRKTGVAVIKRMQLPFVLEKMEKLHKATTNSPLFFLNIFFGASLLFFVLSAFWMYTPKMSKFKKGLYFSIVGFVLTLLVVFL